MCVMDRKSGSLAVRVTGRFAFSHSCTGKDMKELFVPGNRYPEILTVSKNSTVSPGHMTIWQVIRAR